MRRSSPTLPLLLLCIATTVTAVVELSLAPTESICTDLTNMIAAINYSDTTVIHLQNGSYSGGCSGTRVNLASPQGYIVSLVGAGPNATVIELGFTMFARLVVGPFIGDELTFSNMTINGGGNPPTRSEGRGEATNYGSILLTQVDTSVVISNVHVGATSNQVGTFYIQANLTMDNCVIGARRSNDFCGPLRADASDIYVFITNTIFDSDVNGANDVACINNVAYAYISNVNVVNAGGFRFTFGGTYEMRDVVYTGDTEVTMSRPFVDVSNTGDLILTDVEVSGVQMSDNLFSIYTGTGSVAFTRVHVSDCSDSSGGNTIMEVDVSEGPSTFDLTDSSFTNVTNFGGILYVENDVAMTATNVIVSDSQFSGMSDYAAYVYGGIVASHCIFTDIIIDEGYNLFAIGSFTYSAFTDTTFSHLTVGDLVGQEGSGSIALRSGGSAPRGETSAPRGESLGSYCGGSSIMVSRKKRGNPRGELYSYSYFCDMPPINFTRCSFVDISAFSLLQTLSESAMIVESCDFTDLISAFVIEAASPYVNTLVNGSTFTRVDSVSLFTSTNQNSITVTGVDVVDCVSASHAFYFDSPDSYVDGVSVTNTAVQANLMYNENYLAVNQINVSNCHVEESGLAGNTIDVSNATFFNITSSPGFRHGLVAGSTNYVNGSFTATNLTLISAIACDECAAYVGGFLDVNFVRGGVPVVIADYVEFDDAAPGTTIAHLRNYEDYGITAASFVINLNNALFENHNFACDGAAVYAGAWVDVRDVVVRGAHESGIEAGAGSVTRVDIDGTNDVALYFDNNGGSITDSIVTNSNGALYTACESPLYVDNCDFTGFPGATYAGVESEGDTFLSNTRVTQFTNGEFGGGFAVYSGVTELHNTTVSGNTADVGGGVYIDGGKVVVTNGSRISDNSATAYGGGVYSANYDIGTFIDGGVIIDSNSAKFGGGGVGADGGYMTVGNSTITNNVAPVGGGIHIYTGADVVVNGTGIYGNSAVTAGGAVQCESEAICTVVNTVATGNDAGSGGGVFAQFSTLHLNSSYIGGNTASISGSGLSCFTGSLCNVGGSAFESNVGAAGVEILLGGELGMSGSLLNDHDTGLSLFAADAVYVEDSALTGHTGPAIDNSGSPMDLNGVIVRENSGSSAIYVSGSTTGVALNNMFIASNSGSGIACDTSTFSVDDSIICGNAGGGVACQPTCVVTGNSGGCSANNTDCDAQCEADDYCVPITGFYTGPYDGCFECGGNCDSGNYNCTDNAVCIDIPAKFGDYGCECAAGFVGNGFVQCNNTDECATGTHTCSPDARCTDTFGSFVCDCKAGFTGNGVTCANIDECGTGADACSDDAVCTDSHGSYVCDCNPGFYGSGPNCSLCEDHSTSTLGSAKAWNECTCDGGYYRVTTDSNCERCPAGYRRILVPDACVPCGTGTYSLVSDSLTCTSCPEGMVTAGPGSPSSDECYCPYGFIKSSGGALCEVACYPGTYRLATDGCAFCSVGTYTNITNAYECTECPAGSTTADQGAGAVANCTCLPSFYREDPTDFHSKCLRYCPAGSARPADDKCNVCPSDTYTDAANLEECIECPDRAKSASNSTKLTDCRCPRDTYSPDLAYGTVCLPCPEGGQCRGGRNPPESRPNYYPVDGGGFAECSPPEACAGNGQCATGYTGKLCSACDTGYYRLDGKCRKCSGAPGFVLFMFFVCLLAFCAALTWFNTKERALNRFASVVIGVNSLQVIAMYGRLELRWPAAAQWFFDALSIFNFNIELFAPECASPGVSAFWLRWTMTMFMPLMAGFMFALIYAVLVAVVRSGKAPGLAEYTPAYIGWTILRAFFQLMSFVYLPLTAAVFEYFDCIRDPNGEVVISAARDTLCYTPTYWSFLIVALLGVILYPIGVPAAAGYLLWRNHGSMNHIRFELKFGFLVGRYLPHNYYYELLIMARKLGIALVFSFVFQLVYIKAGAGIAVLLAFYSAQLSIQPYRHKLYNEMEMICLACAILVLLFTVTFQAVDVVPGARDAGIVTVLLINLIMIAVGVGLDIQRQIADRIEARADGGSTLFSSTVNDSQASEKEFNELRAVPVGFVAGQQSGLVSVGHEVGEESESIAWTTEDEGSNVISMQPMESYNDSDVVSLQPAETFMGVDDVSSSDAMSPHNSDVVSLQPLETFMGTDDVGGSDAASPQIDSGLSTFQ